LTTRVLYDTSVYIALLRDATFAASFRQRYFDDIPRTYCSSVVIQELVAGVRTPRHRRQAAALYEPFERARRVVTPTHLVWKQAGGVIATLFEQLPHLRSKLSQGLLNDTLIALSGRSIGAVIVTRKREDFRIIQQVKPFTLEVI
jgi:predicted nucleic acid-binding protein